jgi:uncharacterized protein involved in exopolysaccharide biosynthesis
MATKENSLPFVDLLLFLFDRRKILIRITSATVLIALLIHFISPPWYSVTAKIMPNIVDPGQQFLNQYSGLAAMTGINLDNQTGRFELYPEIIHSNYILDNILENQFECNSFETPVTLYEFWEINPDTTENNWRYEMRVKGRNRLKQEYINPQIDKNTGILKIKVRTPEDPVLATNIANFIVDQIEIYNKKERKYKATDELSSIQISIDRIRKTLNTAEQKLQQFKESNVRQNSPGNEIILDRLKSEVDIQRSIYRELRQQHEVTDISRIKQTETFSILEYASVPIESDKMSFISVVIVAVLLGFSFSIALLLLSILYKELTLKASLRRED